MNLDLNFKERLRWALESSTPRRTQADLAKHVGVSPQAIQQWVSGVTTSPQRAKLAAASEFLGVRLEWLAYARGPMTDKDAADNAGAGAVSGQQKAESAILAAEWERNLAAALPESTGELHTTIQHPVGAGSLRLAYLSDDTLAEWVLYRNPAALIAGARAKLWQLATIRAALPPLPERRALLVVAPIEDRAIPERHVEALRAEARLLNIDVQHATTPEHAAALLTHGQHSAPPVPLEDELGLDSPAVV